MHQPYGPNGWPPLLYATYSRIWTSNPDWSSVDTVRVLLDAGADPNCGFLWCGLVPPFTALTGAIGNGESGPPVLPERFAISRLLLAAGADPNDGQALYNNGIGGKNHDDPRHLELLLEFGLGTQQDGPWYRRLGTKLRDPAELLDDELEAAALRNRSYHLRLLIGLGLDIDRPVGRSQKRPVRLAAEHGNHEVLGILAEAGVDTSLTPDEALLDAIRNNDINARTGGNGTTALHEAAKDDDVDRARLFIEHGADPNLDDEHVGSTPWGWANHFHHDRVAASLHPMTTTTARPSSAARSGGRGGIVSTTRVHRSSRALGSRA